MAASPRKPPNLKTISGRLCAPCAVASKVVSTRVSPIDSWEESHGPTACCVSLYRPDRRGDRGNGLQLGAGSRHVSEQAREVSHSLSGRRLERRARQNRRREAAGEVGATGHYRESHRRKWQHRRSGCRASRAGRTFGWRVAAVFLVLWATGYVAFLLFMLLRPVKEGYLPPQPRR